MFDFDLFVLNPIAIPVGFILGFLINFTGVGGGVLLVPALTILFKMDISVAVGTSSLIVTLTKLYATYQHIKLETINYKLSFFFLIGSIPGVLLVAGGINYYLAQLSSDNHVAFQTLLKNIVVWVIFGSIGLMMLQKTKFFKRIKEKIHSKLEYLLLIPAGSLVGMVMGATGIGGGVLIFPSFYLFTKLPSKNIVGSSIFIALILSGATSLIYGDGGQLNINLAINITLGSFFGVALAGFLLKKISNRFLEYFIIILIIMSIVIMLATE